MSRPRTIFVIASRLFTGKRFPPATPGDRFTPFLRHDSRPMGDLFIAKRLAGIRLCKPFNEKKLLLLALRPQLGPLFCAHPDAGLSAPFSCSYHRPFGSAIPRGASRSRVRNTSPPFCLAAQDPLSFFLSKAPKRRSGIFFFPTFLPLGTASSLLYVFFLVSPEHHLFFIANRRTHLEFPSPTPPSPCSFFPFLQACFLPLQTFFTTEGSNFSCFKRLSIPSFPPMLFILFFQRLNSFSPTTEPKLSFRVLNGPVYDPVFSPHPFYSLERVTFSLYADTDSSRDRLAPSASFLDFLPSVRPLLSENSSFPPVCPPVFGITESFFLETCSLRILFFFLCQK